MSNGLTEFLLHHGAVPTMSQSLCDRDAIDGRDPWDDDEITQIIKDLGQVNKYPIWHDLAYEAPKCECGSEKVYGKGASHSSWCPKSKG